ncbi:MAG TPA: tRNA pseudouridine(55) synthase TruB [bacterium]|nr:tRNA pseudouridine(55) synthase TruB [bacterium]
MTGVLILRKPKSWTSHDVVAKVRGILREKQIGHLGTLDPMATGVLPLVVGTATRLIEFASFDKEYRATCLLGKRTDSGDVTGTVLEEKPWDGLEPGKVREAALSLKALTEQVPPMVSAVKRDGRKLYELAREGIEVERKPRPIRIEDLEVTSMELPRVRFRVVCSPGTYVRSLCETLGETLGVGGCLESLERTRVGPFPLERSVTLEVLESLVKDGKVQGALLPASGLAGHLPSVTLADSELTAFCHGREVRAKLEQGQLARVMNSQGLLCGIVEGAGEGVGRPRKVFGIEGWP